VKKTVILLVLLLTLSLCSIASANPGVFITNHALTSWINYDQNNGYSSSYIVSFAGTGQANYKSIDQFTSNAGTFNCEIRIVYNNTNQVIDGTNFVINNANAQDSSTNTTHWSTNFPYKGWYSYQIFANGQFINRFDFCVR